MAHWHWASSSAVSPLVSRSDGRSIRMASGRGAGTPVGSTRAGSPPGGSAASRPNLRSTLTYRQVQTAVEPASERRRWDLNPRLVAQHTISSRADSAALALLRDCSLVRLTIHVWPRPCPPRPSPGGPSNTEPSALLQRGHPIKVVVADEAASSSTGLDFSRQAVHGHVFQNSKRACLECQETAAPAGRRKR